LGIALIAAGLTLIFGVMDIVNFAHGEFYMLGAYGVVILLPYIAGVIGPGIGFWIALVLSSILVAIFAIVLERLTLKPIRERDPLQSLIVTFGVVLILQQAVLEIMGGSQRGMPIPVSGTFSAGAVTYPWLRIATIVGGAVVIIALFIFLRQTRLGIMMRASAQDLDTARTLGVDADRVFSASFAISAALAAFAAGFMGAIRGVAPTMGLTVILDAFIVVIVGGLGSVFGAVIAALLIGLTQALSVLWLPNFMDRIIALALLVVVLLIKPEGLFGD